MPASKEAQDHAVQRAGKIFALIKQAAERGQPCPRNDVLRERFGCGQSAISNALNFLTAAGMIQVERFRSHRIVTIVATGQKTAGEPSRPHWSERRAA